MNTFADALKRPAAPARRPAAVARQGKKHVGAYVDPTIARQPALAIGGQGTARP